MQGQKLHYYWTVAVGLLNYYVRQKSVGQLAVGLASFLVGNVAVHFTPLETFHFSHLQLFIP